MARTTSSTANEAERFRAKVLCVIAKFLRQELNSKHLEPKNLPENSIELADFLQKQSGKNAQEPPAGNVTIQVDVGLPDKRYCGLLLSQLYFMFDIEARLRRPVVFSKIPLAKIVKQTFAAGFELDEQATDQHVRIGPGHYARVPSTQYHFTVEEKCNFTVAQCKDRQKFSKMCIRDALPAAHRKKVEEEIDLADPRDSFRESRMYKLMENNIKNETPISFIAVETLRCFLLGRWPRSLMKKLEDNDCAFFMDEHITFNKDGHPLDHTGKERKITVMEPPNKKSAFTKWMAGDYNEPRFPTHIDYTCDLVDME